DRRLPPEMRLRPCRPDLDATGVTASAREESLELLVVRRRSAGAGGGLFGRGGAAPTRGGARPGFEWRRSRSWGRVSVCAIAAASTRRRPAGGPIPALVWRGRIVV